MRCGAESTVDHNVIFTRKVSISRMKGQCPQVIDQRPGFVGCEDRAEVGHIRSHATAPNLGVQHIAPPYRHMREIGKCNWCFHQLRCSRSFAIPRFTVASRAVFGIQGCRTGQNLRRLVAHPEIRHDIGKIQLTCLGIECY